MTKEYSISFGKNELLIQKRLEKNLELIKKRNPNISENEILKFAIISFLDEFSDNGDGLINIDLFNGSLWKELRARKEDFNFQEKTFLNSLSRKLSCRNNKGEDL